MRETSDLIEECGDGFPPSLPRPLPHSTTGFRWRGTVAVTDYTFIIKYHGNSDAYNKI
ncbi:MAG: hypothetical protein U9O50_03545 [Acidobacteriota bacterium]|nr:hypothetical protein [Acidobacteriota bacterium]